MNYIGRQFPHIQERPKMYVLHVQPPNPSFSKREIFRYMIGGKMKRIFEEIEIDSVSVDCLSTDNPASGNVISLFLVILNF